MFKNIILDPNIKYTNSLYWFIFGKTEYCTEYDSVVIHCLKEIESIGVTVRIQDVSNHKFFYEVDGTTDDYKRVKMLMDNCTVELKEIHNRSKITQMFVNISNWFKGSFNNPTLEQADKLPVIMPEKKMKDAISFRKITEASNDYTIKPLTPVRTKGIRAWFRGSFNNPQDEQDSPNKNVNA